MTNFEFSFTCTRVSSVNVIPTLPAVVRTLSSISTPAPLAPVTVVDLRVILAG